jgi:hypothetical protein
MKIQIPLRQWLLSALVLLLMLYALVHSYHGPSEETIEQSKHAVITREQPVKPGHPGEVQRH